MARALKACGVGKGERVGLLMTNRLEFVSGLFGTALAGGVAQATTVTAVVRVLEAKQPGSKLEVYACRPTACGAPSRSLVRSDFP